MGALESSACAVELPACASLGARRRHRPLTGTAGVALAVSMFLPMMHGCELGAVTHGELPPFWAPYAYGLAFAIFALARGPRMLAIGSTVLRALGWLVVVGGASALASAPPLAVIEIVLGLFLVGAIGWAGTSEPRMASTAVVMGVVSAAWFALWSAAPDALLGTYVALASAIALFAGGLWWLVELAWQPHARLPPAMIRAS